MNAATEVKRHKLTQEDCDTVRLLLARRRTLKEIAEIIGVDPSTVGKIRLANYDLPTYLEQRKEMNRKTKENKRAAIRKMEELEEKMQELPPEVPGQLQMDLEGRNGGDSSAVPPERNEQNRPLVPEADEQKSMMKFQAAMVDKLLKKMDELIEVLRGGAEA